jgi:SAM-dependent methyltransferase
MDSRLLTKIDGFYIADKESDLTALPQRISMGKKFYYKHMGFVYLPVEQDKLTQKQIIDLSNIRDKYFDSLIDKKIINQNYSLFWHLIKLYTRKFRKVNILDFGAGSGGLPSFLRKRRFRFYGIDLNKKYSGNKDYQEYQIISNKLEFQFPNSFFDIVVGCYVFHYNVPAKNLEEIYRVLKKGGFLIFNLYSSSREHKEKLFSKLKSLGFRWKMETFKSDLIFKGMNHHPIDFYVCKKF